MKTLRVIALVWGFACLLSAVAAQSTLVSRALKKPFRIFFERVITPAAHVRSLADEAVSKGREVPQKKAESAIKFVRRHFVDLPGRNSQRAARAVPTSGHDAPSLTNDRIAEGPKVNEWLTVRLTLTPRLVASSLTWDRGAGTNFWTDAANWNPDGIPASGDSIFFTDTGAGVVDLNGTTQPGSGSLGGLTFNNATIGYTLQNGTINLGGNTLTQNSGSSVTNIISAQLNSTGAININSGTLVLTNAGNNIAGAVTVNGGGFQLGNGANTTSLSGVNAPDANSASQGSDGGVAVTVNNSASVNVQALATLTGGAGATNFGTPMGLNGGGGNGAVAILYNGAGSLINGGTITGGAGGAETGIWGVGSGASGGTGGTGVVFTSGGSFNNSGTIRGGKGGDGSYQSSGNGGDGVSFTGSGTWLNTGSIFGGDGGNDLSSASSGGNGGIGAIFGSAGPWTNNGTIAGGSGGSSNNNGPGSGNIGVLLTNGGTLTNNLTINGGSGGSGNNGNSAGSGGTGVYFQAFGSLINSGTITGANGGSLNTFGDGGAGGHGVFLSAGGSVTNSGTIQGGAGGTGGFIMGSPGADGQGVIISGAAGTLWNKNGGSILGGVSLGNFANSVTLEIGSSIAGGLDIGTSAASTLTLSDDGTGGTQNYSLAVTDGTTFAGSLIKNGLGTWVMDQSLGYGGGTFINDFGILAITSDGSLGAGGTGVTFTNGTLRADAAMTLNRAMTITTGNVGFIDTNGNDVTISGVVSGNGGFIKRGNGTLYLTNTGNSQGNDRIDAGVLAIGDDRQLGASGGALFMAGGTMQTTADLATSRPAIIQFGATAIIDSNGHSVTWNGQITENAGIGSLTKAGAGSLALTNANTYTGGTSVNGGTLFVNNTTGSATGSRAVMVNSNASLGGNGIISGAVTVNNSGTLAPGNSAGQLHLGNNLTLNTGSNLAIEIGGLIAGSGYDQIQLAGALTLNAPNLLVSLISGFIPAVNDKFYLIDLTSAALALGTFTNAPAGIYNDGGNYFLVNYFDTDPNDPGHTLGNDISLTYLGMSPVPEPSTWLAAALAASVLVWNWRNQRRIRPGMFAKRKHGSFTGGVL